MRILYHHRIRSKDGQFVHLEEMIAALRDLGHEVHIAGPPAVHEREFGASAGFVGVLKRALPRAVYELLELSYALMDYVRLASAIRRFRPQAIYERYNLLSPAGIWAKRRFGLPLFLEVNAPLYEERREHDGIALERLARWSQHHVWRGANIVAPVTRVLADTAARAGVPVERISVIPNAINARQFGSLPALDDAKRSLGLAGSLVLGFTGFVREWHGLERVLDFMAAAERDDLFLLLVGDGPARASLERRARDLGIAARVRITGIVPRDEIVSYIAAFDIALQPNVVAYASPLKIYEYLALGRPIVAPASPNILEILQHGSNAVLFDPAEAGSFGTALRLLCSDSALRERLARAARDTITERQISWENNARQVVALLERCLSGASEPDRDAQRPCAT